MWPSSSPCTPAAPQARTEAKFGPAHQEAAGALQAARAAHRARYGWEGDLGPRLLDLLVDTRDALGLEDGEEEGGG